MPFHLSTEQANDLFKTAVSAAGFFITRYISKRWEKYKEGKAEKRFLTVTDIDVEINTAIEIIRISNGFDRVTIVNAHNGTSNFQGLSLSKITITHESVRSLEFSVISAFQNYPAALFANEIKKLAESKTGYIHIGPNSGEKKINDIQNIFGVWESWRFRVSKNITDGWLVCSILSSEAKTAVINADKIDEIRYTALQLGILLKSLKSRGILYLVNRFFKKKR